MAEPEVNQMETREPDPNGTEMSNRSENTTATSPSHLVQTPHSTAPAWVATHPHKVESGDASYKEREIPHGSFCGQFFASLKKNIIQKSRDKVSCLLEVFLPILFICGLIGIWAATSPDNFPGRSFINETAVSPFDFNMLPFLFCNNGSNLTNYRPCSMMPDFKSFVPDPRTRVPVPVWACVQSINNELCFNQTMAVPLLYMWLGDWSNMKAIPSLDTMVHLMWIARVGISQQIVDSAYLSPFSAIYRPGFLHFVDGNQTDGIMDQLRLYMAAKSPAFARYMMGNVYPNAAAANGFTRSVDGEGKTWGILEVGKMTPTEFEVNLHMNRSGVPWTNRVQDRFLSGGLGTARFENYYASGFLTLQKLTNQFYIEQVLKQSPPKEPLGAPMPFIAYKQSVFLQAAGQLAPLLIVLSFLYPVSQQTKRIVEEKERRIREAMLIMGLGTGSFYASWMLTYALLYALTAVLATILMKVTFVPQADPLILFFLYYFFCLSCISLSGLLSSLFSKSRLAATLAPLIFFVISIPFFAVGFESNTGLLLGLSLLSPSAFAIGSALVFNYEIAAGIGPKDFASTQDSMNMATIYFFLLFDTLWYFLLTLYLDGVLPSEWGTQEHPCFCYIKCFSLCSSKKHDPNAQFNDNRDPKGVYEPDPRGRPSVELRGLRKEFERGNERFVAVNDLSFNLYEGQIAVLLGHNGAGKTTAINLMTGMLEPTGGDCLIYGKSVLNDMHSVRQEIGFCPQHNILWDELTCREHLEYFGKLKGVSGKELDDSVIEMLEAVDLLEKIDYPSSNLSGGQKRKLSVAIAFVGGSRVVFLDEPTAGMDVGARRFTWDLIRRMSVNRTIVLTTHYMDEADLLGHTISIMANGRLKCKGSSLFLKSRLGVGYTLSIAVDAAAQFDVIERNIRTAIPTADNLAGGSGELSYRLPMDMVPRFPGVLATLETQGAELGVRSFGISVTTIEEVFLRIAEEGDEDIIVTASPEVASPAPRHAGSPVSPASPESVKATEEEIHSHSWAQYKSNKSSFGRQLKALMLKRFQNIKRDRRTQCFQIVMPVFCLILAMLMTLIKFPQSPKLDFTPGMYGVPNEIVYGNCPEWDTITDGYGYRVVVHSLGSSIPNVTAFSDYLRDQFRNHSLLRTTAYYCNDTPTGRPVIFFNASTGIHAAPEALQFYYGTYAKAKWGVSSMVISSQPLDLTVRESAFVNSIYSLVIGIIIMIPFTFIPSTYVSWVVKERECKAKHLQTISGMNFVIYWISNFIFDILSFLVTEILAILVFFAFNRKEYIGGWEEFGAIFCLLLLYGLSGVAGSYLFSFAFDNHASAQNIVMLANFICGFLLVLLNFFLQTIESTADAGKALNYIFRIIPSYCLGEGIINLASREILALIGMEAGAFDLDIIGWDLIYMGIEFPLFYVLTFFMDHPARQMRAQQLFHEPDVNPPPIPNEDEDVVKEREEVESGRRSEDVVLVKHFCKVYPTSGDPKVAVRNLSFGVRPGEVFGFLGTNGAGKTTTISILCGEQLPTHGRGYVGGHDVVEDALAARAAVGYCPQFDALLDLLTAEEHLRLYAGLRGLEAAHIDAVVKSLIFKAGLQEHRRTLAMNMSGGNKRKLSVAIALVGAPTVVFLDEPSAGMDPMARRGLWDVIEAIASKCSVVLTTHHLEEVEALANRVGIMVNGEMRCIGTLQHLKGKFGSGFEMSVRVESEDRVEAFREFMTQHFTNAVESEFRNLKFTYGLHIEDRLSETFRKIEEAKVALGITDYSVSQTSLEQVFLRIGHDANHDE